MGFKNAGGTFGGESFGNHMSTFYRCPRILKISAYTHCYGQLCSQVVFCSQMQVQFPTVSTNRRTAFISYHPHLQSVAGNLGRSQNLQNLGYIKLPCICFQSHILETLGTMFSCLLNHKIKLNPQFSFFLFPLFPTSSLPFLSFSPLFPLFPFFSSPFLDFLLLHWETYFDEIIVI